MEEPHRAGRDEPPLETAAAATGADGGRSRSARGEGEHVGSEELRRVSDCAHSCIKYVRANEVIIPL